MSRISAATLAFLIGLLGAPPAGAQPIIETVVGNFEPSGFPATELPLGLPPAVVADESGNLYVAALRLDQVFQISAEGTVSIVAGRRRRGRAR